MKRTVPSDNAVEVVHRDAALAVGPSEAADYIREMLQCLRALACHPENRVLRSILWLGVIEAKRVIRQEELSPG